jgi:hypothetical protein
MPMSERKRLFGHLHDKIERDQLWREAYDEVLAESKAGQPARSPMADIKDKPEWVPESGVFIMTDSEGYPIYKSEAENFRKKNRVVGVDKWGAVFWVEAKTSRDISPGLDWEFPANILGVKRGLWIVDFGGGRQLDELTRFKKYDARGVMVPRQRRALQDTMLGYKHVYVILDRYDRQADRDREAAIKKHNETDGYSNISW